MQPPRPGATPTSGRSLRALPKVHVHAHLDGSYPREAVLALARRSGVPADLPRSFTDVWHFFEAYGRVPALVRSLDDLVELCRALVAQEAAEGVVYFEPAVEPQLYAPRLGSLAEAAAFRDEVRARFAPFETSEHLVWEQRPAAISE